MGPSIKPKLFILTVFNGLDSRLFQLIIQEVYVVHFSLGNESHKPETCCDLKNGPPQIRSIFQICLAKFAKPLGQVGVWFLGVRLWPEIAFDPCGARLHLKSDVGLSRAPRDI